MEVALQGVAKEVFTSQAQRQKIREAVWSQIGNASVVFVSRWPLEEFNRLNMAAQGYEHQDLWELEAVNSKVCVNTELEVVDVPESAS